MRFSFSDIIRIVNDRLKSNLCLSTNFYNIIKMVYWCSKKKEKEIESKKLQSPQGSVSCELLQECVGIKTLHFVKNKEWNPIPEKQTRQIETN